MARKRRRGGTKGGLKGRWGRFGKGQGVVQFRVGITLDFRGDVGTSLSRYLTMLYLVFCLFLWISYTACESVSSFLPM